MNDTTISWAERVWNPWSGCKKVSPGCANCYAETLAERFRGTEQFPNGFDLTYRLRKLEEPLRLKKPSRIFVNSMSDLYLEEVPLANIQRVFDVMNRAHWHQFLILTKRSKRLLEIAPQLNWTPNIWQGVSVENQHWTPMIDDLVQVPAAIRFLSIEPLLGPVDISPWIEKLDWVIVGGESGKGFRKMDKSWACAIRDQCLKAAVPFWYKQSNGFRSETDPLLDGKEWRQLPRSERRSKESMKERPSRAFAEYLGSQEEQPNNGEDRSSSQDESKDTTN